MVGAMTVPMSARSQSTTTVLAISLLSVGIVVALFVGVFLSTRTSTSSDWLHHWHRVQIDKINCVVNDLSKSAISCDWNEVPAP
jgi:hypothetical protein